MKKFCFILCCLLPCFALAAANNRPVIGLENAHVNVQDRASILRGAAYYRDHCMSCHSLRYLVHDPIAKESGITLDKMPAHNQEWWLGIVPPDLTLMVGQKSANWLYTYLHAFYKDPSRPTGSNNLLSPDINMPNLFLAVQGEQVLIEPKKSDLQHHWGSPPLRYFQVLKATSPGSMSSEEFDQTMRDLVNFLTYASEPSKVESERIGWWVMGFFAILTILAFLLYREYWKDIDL